MLVFVLFLYVLNYCINIIFLKNKNNYNYPSYKFVFHGYDKSWYLFESFSMSTLLEGFCDDVLLVVCGLL